jgi:hypothetical protein
VNPGTMEIDRNRCALTMARFWGLCVFLLAVQQFAASIQAQVTWTPIPNAPNAQWGSSVFSPSTGRLISFDSTDLYEFDGSTWSHRSTLPFGGGGSGGWFQYDYHRGVVLIAASAAATPTLLELWEWNGTSLTPRGPVPAPLTGATYGMFASSDPATGGGTFQLMFHPGVQGPLLTSWNGVYFSQMAGGSVVPPTIGSLGSQYYYRGFAYDESIDRLVLFGRSHVSSQGQVLAIEGITWEWSASAGWQLLGSSGPIPSQTRIWFDTHRGCLMRSQSQSGVTSYFRRTGPTSWSSVPWHGNPLFLFPYTESYDGLNNRLYAMSMSGSLGYIGDAFPSSFSLRRPGCGSPSQPNLRLTESWTRAWIGETHSVAIENLSGPLAGIGMGFGEQTYGGAPLPLSLDGVGMPQCFLNIDVAAATTVPVVGNVATWTLLIPFTQSLVGIEYFLQPFAAVPGANAAGILVGDSFRGTVGRQQ